MLVKVLVKVVVKVLVKVIVKVVVKVVVKVICKRGSKGPSYCFILISKPGLQMVWLLIFNGCGQTAMDKQILHF